MPWDLTVTLENRPGTLATMGEALGARGINIDGGCGFPCEGQGVVHLLVEDGGAARDALESAGIDVGEQREVIVFETDDRPGELGSRARSMADAGVNVDLMYLTTGGQIVFGVDDLSKAQAAG